MTTATLTRPAPPSVDEDGFHHLFCCDEEQALCGVPITSIVDEVDPEKLCPMCDVINERGEHCPHEGCSYVR